MSPTVITKSQVVEEESVSAVTQLIKAVVVLGLCLLLVYLFGFIGNRQLALTLRILAGVGALAALVWAVMEGLRIKKARGVESVTVNCPYCEFPMQFVQPPTADYDCEACHRRVQYENGHPVPIRQITCAFCKTVHKVSAKAKQYTCDACNRALKLTDDPREVVAERSDVLQNYDVLLTDIGRQKNEVAMALESILVCNLVEARRQMENLPLTIVRNVPERKADAVRRRLRDLGATAVVRPTSDQVPARR